MINISDNLKKDFLQDISSTSVGVYGPILKGARRKEILFNKNVYEFNQNEFEELIKSYRLNSLNSIRSYINVLRSFIRYCIAKGYGTSEPIEGRLEPNWIKRFLPELPPYLPDYEFNRIVDACVNPQDAVILQLLFEGVYGKEFSELLNLKVSDVQDNNILKLNDKGKIRYLGVSQKCVDLIFQADKQTYYNYRNGDSKANRKGSNLIPSKFVLKSNFTGHYGKGTGDSDHHLINRRVASIAEFFNLYSKKPTFFADSGTIALAKNICEEYGYFAQKIALQQISERFNLGMPSGERKYYPETIRNLTSAHMIYNVYNLEFDEDVIPSFELIDVLQKDRANKTEVNRRVGQDNFRDEVERIYSGKCAITNDTVRPVLQAAHIQEYINEHSHHKQNGILLRVDFHKLFDVGLITINDDYTISISAKVNSTYYQSFNGQKLNLPRHEHHYPSKVALEYHRNKFKENFSIKDQ